MNGGKGMSGRNAPCPCGSGRKFKRCCGQARRQGRAAEGSALTASVRNKCLEAQRLAGASQYGEAAVYYQQVLQLDSGCVEAWIGLADLLQVAGRVPEAVEVYRTAVARVPDSADLHYNFGCVLQVAGDTDSALGEYRRALELDRRHARAHNNAASVLHVQGQLKEAVEGYRQALGLDHGYVDARYNLAAALHEQGSAEEAVEHYKKVIGKSPDHWRARLGLGAALDALGYSDKAIECYQRTLLLFPSCTEAALRLGNAFLRQARAPDAERSYRDVLAAQPKHRDARCNLGHALLQQGDISGAIDSFRHVVDDSPTDAGAWLDLGNALLAAKRIDDASQAYRQAAFYEPNNAGMQAALGSGLLADGLLKEGIGCLTDALALQPSFAAVHSDLLFALNYLPDGDPQHILETHLDFGRRHSVSVEETSTSPSLLCRSGRRLRVGYVSADFRQHALSYFIEPVLEHHDRAAVEVFCYYSNDVSDQVTDRLRSHVEHWRQVACLSDVDLGRQIVADGVDVLVDLAGHTAGSRLTAFARRLAPVQATWVGYLNTTGLAAMDYRITDWYASPEGQADKLHCERLVRLPHSQWCYKPPVECPDVGGLPCVRNGYVTFGSFHNAIKVNPEVVLLWAKIVAAVPKSRLCVVGCLSARHREAIADNFAAVGVAPSRLNFTGELSFRDYLGMHNEVDINLDTFPYTGGTTTCHSLWMGVPVITMTGATVTSRGGASLLNVVGLPELVAGSPVSYVDSAVRLASDCAALAKLRAGLRARVAQSPLTDAVEFTKDLEHVFQLMQEERMRRV